MKIKDVSLFWVGIVSLMMINYLVYKLATPLEMLLFHSFFFPVALLGLARYELGMLNKSLMKLWGTWMGFSVFWCALSKILFDLLAEETRKLQFVIAVISKGGKEMKELAVAFLRTQNTDNLLLLVSLYIAVGLVTMLASWMFFVKTLAIKNEMKKAKAALLQEPTKAGVE